MCAISSWELSKAVVKIQASRLTEVIYNEEECLRLKEHVKPLREAFIHEVFSSTPPNIGSSQWYENFSKKGQWIFSPVRIRKKLFEKADVEIKHLTHQIVQQMKLVSDNCLATFKELHQNQLEYQVNDEK